MTYSTGNLAISRRCFTEDSKERYENEKRSPNMQKSLFLFINYTVFVVVAVVIRELTNRRLFLDGAVGFRGMPTAHPHKQTSSVAPKSTTLVLGICRRLKTAGREVSFWCFLPIVRVFLPHDFGAK